MVFSPEHNTWFLYFGPDLAAKYSAQGCLVALMPDGNTVLPLPAGKRAADFPEAEPQKPPYSYRDVVWNYRAAEYAPEAYAADWERTAEWLRSVYRHPRPEDIAENLSREVGRWGGGYDLEVAGMDHRRGLGIDGGTVGAGRMHVRHDAGGVSSRRRRGGRAGSEGNEA